MGLAARRLAILLLAVCLAACGCVRETTRAVRDGGPPPAPDAGRFLDARGPLDLDQAGEAAARADYVLIGEGHPYACDHQAQADLVAAMARAGAAPAVGLEMVSLDRQDVLDRFNQGRMAPEDLEKALDWPDTWGFPFALYRPIFETARRLGLPLYALNVPKSLVRDVGRSGLAALGPTARRRLPGPVIEASPEQREALRPAFESHPDTPRGKAWERFLAVQALWDSAMAHRAGAVHRATGRPVAILAGSGHVERGLGVAARLAVIDPQAKRLLVLPWRGGDAPDAALADLFFHCPAQRRPLLGLRLEPRGDALAVTAVDAGSKAQAAGFETGDVLLSAGASSVRSALDIHAAAVAAAGRREALAFEVLRAGRIVILFVPLEAAKAGE